MPLDLSGKGAAMSRRNITAAVAAIGFMIIATGASAQDEPPVMQRAEDCLRANVDRVVAVEPDVNSAAAFLLSYACPEEVARAARYEMNSALLSGLNATAKSVATISAPTINGRPVGVKAAPMASVSPETGDIVTPPASAASPAGMGSEVLSGVGRVVDLAANTAPASLRRYAGELVLGAREHQLRP
jgi:hypothetical protein